MKDGEGHERICGTAGNMAPNCSCTEGENRRAVHAARGQSPLRCRARSREIGDSGRTNHKPRAEQGFHGNVEEQCNGDETGHGSGITKNRWIENSALKPPVGRTPQTTQVA